MRARHRHFSPAHAGATIALDSRYGFSQADGSAVSTWEDRSTTNNDATQATPANQPTYETNEVGGQPAVRFDGADDFLSYATSVFNFTDGATVIAVVKATSAASDYGSVIAEHNSNRSSLGCQLTVFPNNAIEPCTDMYAPAGVRYNSTLANTTWQIVAWSWSNWSTHRTNGNTRIAAGGTESTGAAYGGVDPLSFSSTRRAIGRFPDGGLTSGSMLQADMALVAKLPECGAALRKRLYHHAAYSFKLACN
jgi:hypothetical protein